MQLHGPGRAGLDAEAAGDAFRIVESNYHSADLIAESPGRANGDTSAAGSASFLIAGYILAERLDFNSAIN